MSISDLAKAVRERRLSLDLSQESLVRYGGPSHQIVRNIEQALDAEYRDATLRKLDRALCWPAGSAAELLRSGVPPTPLSASARRVEPDWGALAQAVQARRVQLRMRQLDVERNGGPGPGTMRNIEQAARDNYSLRTFASLERVLQWPEGTIGQILDGTAAEGVLTAPVQSGVPPTPLDPAEAISAPVPALSAPTPAALSPDDELALRLGRLVLAYLRTEGVSA